jgi:cob(I)alamin adenosyltransferase
MLQSMRIYTRGGDEGDTSLVGGARISKASRRVHAYGAVDELLSYLGVIRSGSPPIELDRLLATLQDDLMVVACDLAAPGGSADPPRMRRLEPSRVQHLEEQIDAHQAQVPELRHFILPAGTPAGAALHHARTVARRAERLVVELAADQAVGEAVLPYLNRLSDLLFVLGRWANHRAGASEEPWNAPPV